MLLCELFEVPSESFLAEFRSVEDIRFVKNPTADSLYRLVTSSKGEGARGVAYGKDVFWWDDFDAIHSEAANMLGVPYLKEYDNRLYAVQRDTVVISGADEAAPLFRRIAERSKDRFEFNMLGAKWEAEDFLEQLDIYEK